MGLKTRVKQRRDPPSARVLRLLERILHGLHLYYTIPLQRPQTIWEAKAPATTTCRHISFIYRPIVTTATPDHRHKVHIYFCVADRIALESEAPAGCQRGGHPRGEARNMQPSRAWSGDEVSLIILFDSEPLHKIPGSFPGQSLFSTLGRGGLWLWLWTGGGCVEGGSVHRLEWNVFIPLISGLLLSAVMCLLGVCGTASFGRRAHLVATNCSDHVSYLMTASI